MIYRLMRQKNKNCIVGKEVEKFVVPFISTSSLFSQAASQFCDVGTIFFIIIITFLHIRYSYNTIRSAIFPSSRLKFFTRLVRKKLRLFDKLLVFVTCLLSKNYCTHDPTLN